MSPKHAATFSMPPLPRLIAPLICVVLAGCGGYSPPTEGPTAQLVASISGFSTRQTGGSISISTPQCSDKAWRPQQVFSTNGYTGKVLPEGSVAVTAQRPIVLGYAHSSPINSQSVAVCGKQLIVKLDADAKYEARGAMVAVPGAKPWEYLGSCTFELIDVRTGRPVAPASLGCDKAP